MDEEQKKVIFTLFIILIVAALVVLALENKDAVEKAFSIDLDSLFLEIQNPPI